MAAGLIQENVTTVSGVSIPLTFWVDDTITPTMYIPISIAVDSAGNPIIDDTAGAMKSKLVDGAGVSAMDDTNHAAYVRGIGVDKDTTYSNETGSIVMGLFETTAGGGASGDLGFASYNPTTGGQRVDGSGVTQPVSNTLFTNVGAMEYETVGSSQTGAVIGSTGGIGDYLSHIIVSPQSANCGVVTVYDNTNDAAHTVVSFPGGGSVPLSNLIPFICPVGMLSTSGAWKVDTGANIIVAAVGNFT